MLETIMMEICKVIGALILVAGAWVVTRRLNNKEHRAKEDDRDKNNFKFFQEQFSINTKAITTVFETKTGAIIEKITDRLDEGDKRFDKLESTVREIAGKIPMYREPNGHKKCLLVEDDVMNADLITDFLIQMDVFVVRVNSSKEAIRKVNQYHKKPFNLAITDKRLKGDLADDFINYCIENNILVGGDNELKILLYSACESVKNNKWGLPHLEKPFNREHFQEKVKVYL